MNRSLLSECMLCPRRCGADRNGGKTGFCGMTSVPVVARAALHYWEEPCLSGTDGSGAVFFSGCTLKCVYCQNAAISRYKAGREISRERLAEIFLELQEQHAYNINLVTAGHFAPQIVQALEDAKSRGLSIPVVYNSSGYERTETLRMFSGLVDIYLPDLKYLDRNLAKALSGAEDYPDAAKAAIAEMVRQQERPVFDEKGMMQKGVIVRHLVLPGHVKEAKAVIQYLYETYGSKIYLSILSQYTPTEAVADDPLLRRRVTAREYERVLTYAVELGVEQGYFQEGGTAKESFIPEFDETGV